MECVTSPKFSVSINGELHGFFSSGRGIRQGDPMSPYLFTLVMETFSGILQTHTLLPGFKYFWRCKSTRLSHLFFADDVLLFAEGNRPSITLLKDALVQFSAWSGLHPNPHKSEVYLSGGAVDLRNNLISILGFSEGKLPFRYLGVPVIASRLSRSDCNYLVSAITSRAQSWSQRFLSFAGRLQLIKSVLHAIHVYWASVFTLPKSVLASIERILRQFLWKGPGLGTGGAKVSWCDVCLPKEEGGLGIRCLVDCNQAAMLKHIWLLFTDKESLWCRWVHSNFLKNINFWVAPQPTFCSWAWKKILQLRHVFLSFSKWCIGDGSTVSFWFDAWHPRGPLYLLFSNRDIYRSGIPRIASVCDSFAAGHRNSDALTVIHAWLDTLPSLVGGSADRFTWTACPSGLFSVASAWNAIRKKGTLVRWHRFIWDRIITPRHAFLLWLITLNRLPTQVILLNYRRIAEGVCAFCRSRPDSIDHLFFGCSVTASLASFWAAKCNIVWTNRPWQDNVDWAILVFGGHHFHQCLTRFSFAALCHLIWTERNNILFRNQVRFVPALKEHLVKVVKDKAMTFTNVIDSVRNRRLIRSWGCSPSILSPGGSATL